MRVQGMYNGGTRESNGGQGGPRESKRVKGGGPKGSKRGPRSVRGVSNEGPVDFKIPSRDFGFFSGSSGLRYACSPPVTKVKFN